MPAETRADRVEITSLPAFRGEIHEAQGRFFVRGNLDPTTYLVDDQATFADLDDLAARLVAKGCIVVGRLMVNWASADHGVPHVRVAAEAWAGLDRRHAVTYGAGPEALARTRAERAAHEPEITRARVTLERAMAVQTYAEDGIAPGRVPGLSRPVRGMAA